MGVCCRIDTRADAELHSPLTGDPLISPTIYSLITKNGKKNSDNDCIYLTVLRRKKNKGTVQARMPSQLISGLGPQYGIKTLEKKERERERDQRLGY